MKCEERAAPPWSDLPQPIPWEETEWLQDNRELLSSDFLHTLEQVQAIHPGGELPDADVTWRMYRLAQLLVAQARESQHSGDLPVVLTTYQAALHVCDMLRPHGNSEDWYRANDRESLVLQSLLFWATADGQTGDQLQQAIEWSQSWLGREQEWITPLTADHQRQRQVLREILFSHSQSDLRPVDIERLHSWFSIVPGERQRWQRLLNVQEATFRAGVQLCIDDVRDQGDMRRVFRHGSWDDPSWLLSTPVDRRRLSTWNKLNAWTVSTPLIRDFLWGDWHPRDLLISNLLQENQRRATHLSLRLIHWRLQHGSYPTRGEWQQVTRDHNLPPDVLTGMPFKYLPKGLHNDNVRYLYVGSPLDGAYFDASGQPVLASPEALAEDFAEIYLRDSFLRVSASAAECRSAAWATDRGAEEPSSGGTEDN